MRVTTEREGVTILMMSEQELLKYALDNGIINIDTIQQQVELNERKKYLEKHSFRVWQGTNGKFYTYLPDEAAHNGRRMIKKSSESDLRDEIVAFYKAQERDPYIKDIFEAWVNQKLAYGEIKKQTYDRYKTDFTRFFEGTKIAEKRFGLITEEMLEDFIKTTIHDQHLTKRGFGNLRILILGIFKYAKKKGYTRISITSFIGDLQISQNSFRKRVFTDEESVFTNEELEKIREYIDTHPASIISLGVLLAIETGVRIGELSALRPKDLEGRVLHVRRTEERFKDDAGHYVFRVREMTKGRDGARRVIVTERAVEIVKEIRRLNPLGEYLFMEDGARIKAKAFTVKIQKICRYVGIRERSMHKVRKTYATKLLNKGVDEKLVIRQMGHTDIATTKGYYYFDNRTMEEAQSIIEAAIG